jgi:hypothetical protein
MRPQVRSNKARFRHSPSRCQRFWQGILVLATLALAVAAKASPACYDMFASRNAPLRPGNSVTLRYSFPDANLNILSNPGVRAEIASSAARESHRLQEKGGVLRQELASLENKTSTKAIARKSEVMGALKINRAILERVSQIQEVASGGRPLRADDLTLLRSYTFEQTITLNGRADSRLLNQRLLTLDGHLAAVENVKLPPSRIKRVYRWMMNHKVMTLVLASALMSGGNYGYDLYVSAQAERNAPVMVSIYDGGGSAPVTTARDNPQEAIGN